MRVRRADHDDKPWLLAQLRAFAAFFSTRVNLFPDDANEADAALTDMIERHLVLVAENDEDQSCRYADMGAPFVPERLGFIAGYLHPHPFNKAVRTLTETFWWVPPEHRGTRAGSALIDEFILFGREHCNLVVMTLEAESPVREEALTKRGFRLKERSYLLEIPKAVTA